MPSPQQVSINFFPLDPQDFEFNVFRTPYVEGAAAEHPNWHRYRLPQTLPEPQNQASDWPDWWVSFSNHDGLQPFVCNARTNVTITQRLLMDLLVERATAQLQVDDFKVWHGFHRRVEFVVERFPERGEQCVWLSPYYLRNRSVFGFLADFHFRRREDAPFDREILRLARISHNACRSQGLVGGGGGAGVPAGI